MACSRVNLLLNKTRRQGGIQCNNGHAKFRETRPTGSTLTMTGRNTGSGSRSTFLILLLKKCKLTIMAMNAVHNQSASSTLNLSCANVSVLLGSTETGISDDVTTTFHVNLTSEFTDGISKAHDTSTALDQGRRQRFRGPAKNFFALSPPPPPGKGGHTFLL